MHDSVERGMEELDCSGVAGREKRDERAAMVGSEEALTRRRRWCRSIAVVTNCQLEFLIAVMSKLTWDDIIREDR